MIKRFVNGLIFGAGFGVAFTGIWMVVMYYVLPTIYTKQVTATDNSSLNTNVITNAPPLLDAQKFLGSSGVYSGSFIHNNSKILAAGNGVITGTALVNNEPLSGLKLRLALNNQVVTQWTETDPQGVYHISVPYGDYKIDGYELDMSAANRVLPGKITHPGAIHSRAKFSVNAELEGRGLKFRFVDPILKVLEKTKYSSGESIVLKWSPYPDANEYTVQVYEKEDADSWRRTPMFDWPYRPTVFGTNLDLSKYDIQLKPGHYYSYEVEAKNESLGVISSTHTDFQGFDFEFRD